MNDHDFVGDQPFDRNMFFEHPTNPGKLKLMVFPEDIEELCFHRKE